MKKFLGQHFLKNKIAIKKIVAALDLRPNDTIIEIGTGAGALTFPLLEECKKLNCKVIGIEKDPSLVKNLESRIKNYGNAKIISGDALKILPTIIHDSSFIIQRYKIIGNIPYYITGKLLRTLSELENKPKLVVLMIQKEVAERITAKPRGMNPVRGREGSQRASASNGMNLLAAAVQFWAEPKILFTLKPGDFNPPPKVDSAVIKLTPKPHTLNPEMYYKLIHVIFKQPRKTLLNNLRNGLKLPTSETENILKSLKIDPKSRPQNLSLKQIETMANLINQ